MRMMSSLLESEPRELSSFPEYVTAKEDISKGQFKRALPGVQRVHAVISSALGPASPSAIHILLRSARLLHLLGDFEVADMQLKEVIRGRAGEVRDQDAVQMLHASALMRLFGSSGRGALEAAAKSLEICQGVAEQHVSSSASSQIDVPTSLFSPSHALLGLTHLHEGEVHEAETHLQLAARWADTLPAQMAALNNLGVLYWTFGKNPEEGSSARPDRRRLLIEAKSLWRRSEATPAAPSEAAGAQGATEALLYWRDAIAEASRDATQQQGAGGAGMCAPPSSVDPLGPGMKMTAVPAASSSSPAPAAAPAIAPDDVLAARLRNVSFAVAYATLLCNCAEAHEALGEAAEAAEALGSALRALDPHKDALESHPALGRALSLMAFTNMGASLAVTAEGLFRSALDKFQGPYGLSDPRYMHEHALATGGYGVLLSKWERREGDGRAMLERAGKLFAGLPSYPVPLTAALLYPGLPH